MSINTWHSICITDKTGQEFFKTTASPMSTMSEIRNMKRHIAQAKASPEAYSFLDVDTAVIILDGVLYGEAGGDIDVDALLRELGL